MLIEFTPEELDRIGAAFDLARAGRTAELTALVDSGWPVNLTNTQGDSLLILAAYYRHADTVAALILRGADLDRVNDRGQTAVSAAVFRSDAVTVRALLDAGADPELGRQNAPAVAAFFDLPEMTALLAGHHHPSTGA